MSTFVEAPLQIQQRQKFPDVMYQQCQSQNIPVSGNAAGHTLNNGGLSDLSDEPAPPDPLPGGFTAKGYGAMAGCCIAAVMGLITIAWYGLTDSPEERPASDIGTDSDAEPVLIDQHEVQNVSIEPETT